MRAAMGVPACEGVGSGLGARGAGEPAGVVEPDGGARTAAGGAFGRGGAGRVTGGGEPALGRLFDVGETLPTAARFEMDWRERRLRDATAPVLTTCSRLTACGEGSTSARAASSLRGTKRTGRPARLADLVLLHVEVLEVARAVPVEQAVEDLLPSFAAVLTRSSAVCSSEKKTEGDGRRTAATAVPAQSRPRSSPATAS